jgi:hypothetical protein
MNKEPKIVVIGEVKVPGEYNKCKSGSCGSYVL